jgi:hypothetical protein
MAMACPQCGKNYEQRLDCQLCGVRLVFHDARRLAGQRSRLSGRWQQTAWGRVLIGLFVAQGLLYALRQLLSGALQVLQADSSPEEVWGSPTGVILLGCLSLGTLLVGAVFAGAGQARGPLLGTIVAVGNSVLTILWQRAPGKVFTPLEMYGQPLLQAAFGALGGWVGMLVWRPLPSGEPRFKDVKKGPRAFRADSLFAGKVAWVRVGVGALLAVAGTLSAGALFDMAIDASDGKLATSDEMQDYVIIWEIKALAMLLGGGLAGATTRNGAKQGLAVGIICSAILIGIGINRQPRWLLAAGLALASALPLCLAGGWFGSQLFPPVFRLRRKGRLDHAV